MILIDIKNKKGIVSILSLILVGGIFIYLIFMLGFGISLYYINAALNQDIDIGQVNLATLNSQTLGKSIEAILNNADFWGLCIIAGSVLSLFLVSYMARGFSHKIVLIFDIFIIIGVFLFSLYISSSYQLLMDSLAEANITFLEDYVPKTSSFLLNLPIYIVIICSVCLVLFYSAIPRKQEDAVYQSGGYLQGAY